MLYKHLLILLLFLPMLTFVRTANPAVSKQINFDSVRKMAIELSSRPYVSAPNDLPQSLLQLNYDAYRAINYRHEKAVWSHKGLPFGLEFYHRGYLYNEPVDIYLVEGEKVSRVKYQPNLFNYKWGKPAKIKGNIGFAGLKILYHPDIRKGVDEVVSFLGSNYFRAVPIGGFYGVSARGIAVDTVTENFEEFPAFRKMWIVRPELGDVILTVYALLDSPSLAGAYQFQIKPGSQTIIDVQQGLFTRKPIQALGIAPLTSMFYYGENKNNVPSQLDSRPEIHDSDGLLLNTGSGQWLWRPLHNPEQNLISYFSADNSLKGFGLIQRDRDIQNYNDPNTSFEKRPSVWVQPGDNWPAGRLLLLELHSKGEGMDNIIAQYLLDSSPAVASELNLKYRLTFYSNEKPLHNLARVISTVSKQFENGSIHYEIGFEAGISFPSSPMPLVTANGADVSDVRLSIEPDVYRTSFVVSPKGGPETIELRASLNIADVPVSEIWSDQWKL